MRPQVICSIPFRDIWGGDGVTQEQLEQMIAAMDWRDVVTTAGGISAIAWRTGIEDDTHIPIIESFVGDLPIYGQPLIMKLRSDLSQVLLTDESLLAVLRLAVVGGAMTDALTNSEFRDRFVRAVTMANELIHRELDPPHRTGSPEDLMASEIRSKASIFDNPHVLLARTAAFLDWAKDANRPQTPDELPIESDFRAFTGLTPMEYAAGAYSMLGRSAGISGPIGIRRDSILSTMDKWLNGLADPRVPQTWLLENSLVLEDVRREWKDEPSLSFAGAGKLWRKPVVRDGNTFFVPSSKLVLNAMGDGMYFALLDGYQNASKHKFTRLYGYFFQDYAAERIERGYAHRSDAEVYRSHIYGPKNKRIESTDLIVVENGNVLFFEAVAKRTRLVESVLRLDAKSIEVDIRRGILKKARELHNRITDFRAGRLLPEVPRFEGQRIYPIIISPKDWPRIQILRRFWPDEQRREGLLVDTEPVEILDIDEVEWLENMLGSGVRLAELLDRKNRPPTGRESDRLQSLHDYLALNEPGLIPQDTEARIRGDQIGEHIMELARSWGAA